MKTNDLYRSRLLSVALIIVLTACFWLVCAGKTYAAAKKTFYVPTKVTEKRINADGSEQTYVTRYKYYKTGLRKSDTSNGYKTVYKRNKDGWITNILSYNDEGDLMSEFVYKFKKGFPSKGAYYNISNGEKGDPVEKYKYTYNKKGQLTKTVYTDMMSGHGFTQTIKYHSNGVKKESKTESEITTYDKKGNITKSVYKGSGDDYEISTYKNSYNKKGYMKKCVMKTESEYGHETYNYEATETYKYEYTKAGKPSKCTITTKYKTTDGTTGTSIVMITYKYKKVKVAKKYWKFID